MKVVSIIGIIALLVVSSYGQQQNPPTGGGTGTAAQLTTTGSQNATGTGGGGMGDPNKSIIECLKGIDKLSLVNMALGRPEIKELADKLNKKGDGEFTLFAPTNDAVGSMLQTANTSLANQTFSEEDKQSLMVSGIHYHVVPKKLLTKNMKQLELPVTLLNDSKWVKLGGKSQRLHIMDETGTKKFQIWFGLDKDGREKRANFLVNDIECSNGVIHIIDKVVEIPLESSKILQSGGLTKFVDAIKKAGLENKLDNTEGVTIFAPTNNAFESFGGEHENELKNLLGNLIQEGLFYIKADSSGPIQFKKPGEIDEKDANATQPGSATGASTATGAANATGGGTGGIRRLLQALANATTGATGAQQATGASNATTGAAPGAATANDTKSAKEWKLTGSFNNWKIDNVQVIVHDVMTKNGVIHVVDKIVGAPKAANATGNATKGLSCSDMKCPSGDQCCDVTIDSAEEITPRCYSPATHVCASRGGFLCGKDAPLVCGLHCYSSSQFVCHSGLFLCPKAAPRLCGVACYDGQQFKCVEGNLKLLGDEDKKKDKQC